MERPMIIGVIGAGRASAAGREAAMEVGRLIARGGAALVCGGLGGVMEAAARGCREEGGTVIGILPGGDPGQANPFVTYPVATNMGHARNMIIVHTARALIAVEGEYGTLSEIAIALKLGRPVIALDSWAAIEGVERASTPRQAVERAIGSGPAPAREAR